MSRLRLRLLCAVCLLLALAACGNKGPLVLPDEDKPKKTQSSAD